MKYLIWILLLTLFSCNKEKTTYASGFWVNSTSHYIEVRPVSKGLVVSQNILRLMPGQKLQVGGASFRGILDHQLFDNEYFSDADSVLVIYDSTFVVSHYFVTPSSVRPKHHLRLSSRNIINQANYDFKYEDDSKHKRQTFSTYTFTEQDYLDAK